MVKTRARQIVIQIRLGRELLGRQAFAERRDLLQFVGAEDGVHFRHILLDVGAITLDQAAGDDQPLRSAGLLVLGHLEDRVDRFLLGRDR